MDIFRLDAIVTRVYFSAVNTDYEWFFCAYQRLFGGNIPSLSNDRYGSVSCRSVTGGVIGRKVPFTYRRNRVDRIFPNDQPALDSAFTLNRMEANHAHHWQGKKRL